MTLPPEDAAFVEEHASAAMITVGRDGTPRVAGDDAPELNLRLFRKMQNKPTGPLGWFTGELSEEEFLAVMRDEQRLIYEFDVLRSYGMR